MKTTYFYMADDYGPFEIESTWSLDNHTYSYLAEEAAEDFYHNHDGWEHKWPLKISIQRGDGGEPVHFEIEMEAVPAFYANVL